MGTRGLERPLADPSEESMSSKIKKANEINMRVLSINFS
jgi:hypothetical protein